MSTMTGFLSYEVTCLAYVSAPGAVEEQRLRLRLMRRNVGIHFLWLPFFHPSALLCLLPFPLLSSAAAAAAAHVAHVAHVAAAAAVAAGSPWPGPDKLLRSLVHSYCWAPERSGAPAAEGDTFLWTV